MPHLTRSRAPQPAGITSKGEIIREAPVPIPLLATREIPMPRTRETEEVRGADVPLAIAAAAADLPPDAATDPDFEMPDSDTKGYHTGLVRQPAEPVLTTATGEVRFETLGEAPSKFERGSLDELKAAHNEAEAGGIEGAIEHVSIAPATDAIGNAPAAQRRAAAEAAAATPAPATPQGGDVNTTSASEINGGSSEVTPAEAARASGGRRR